MSTPIIVPPPPNGPASRRAVRNVAVRVGCRLAYQIPQDVAAVFKLRPRIDAHQMLEDEFLRFGHDLPYEDADDGRDNRMQRLLLPAGSVEIRHDAIVSVPCVLDNHDQADDLLLSPLHLPAEAVRCTLPSRYCDSDKLLNLAWSTFAGVPGGHERVRAICDWVHEHVEYRFGSGRSDIAASEVVSQGFGVCRDFAHVGIALCRAMNIPARYVTGHLPDIGYVDPGSPMDFHAYMEVYLGGKWFTYDPRYNVPRIGRVAIARGLDAVDGAFATIYGSAQLSYFEVWAYQTPLDAGTVGEPIDLSRRLDGTETIRFE